MKKLLFIVLTLLSLQASAQFTSTLPAGYTPFATQMYYKISAGDTTFIEGANGKGFHRIASTKSVWDSLASFYTKAASDGRFTPLARSITINGSTLDLSSNRTWNVGTVTSVYAGAGTGISVSGSPITTTGNIVITNTAPDQTVALTGGTGISTTGTYPNFTITNTSPSSGGTVTSIAKGVGLVSDGAITSTGTINIDTGFVRTVSNSLSKAQIQTALNLKESLSNKATDLASPDNTKYPTTLAVVTNLLNYVDLSTDQTVGGVKTLTSNPTVSRASSSVEGSMTFATALASKWRVGMAIGEIDFAVLNTNTLGSAAFRINSTTNIPSFPALNTNGVVTSTGGNGVLAVIGTTGTNSAVLNTSPTIATPTFTGVSVVTGDININGLSNRSIGWGGNSSASAANPLIYSDKNYLAINSKAGHTLYFNPDNTNASSYVDFFLGKVTIDKDGNTVAPRIKLTAGASNGYVLKSDASGNATWQPTTSSYKGTWNASTNSPTVADGVGSTGDYYEVSTAGTQFGRSFSSGGRAIYNGSIWEPSGAVASVTSVNGYTGTVVLAKSDLGLSNVDNTSDLNKPISTATQTALDLKATLASPALTGTPTAPTASGGTSTTQIASTAFVSSAISGYLPLTGGELSGNLKGTSFQMTDAAATNYYFQTGANYAEWYDGSGRIRLQGGNTILTGSLSGATSISTTGNITVNNGQYLQAKRNTGGIAINVLGFASGSDDLIQTTSDTYRLRNTASTDLLTVTNTGAVAATGNITGANLSGTNTGDQTWTTLTGKPSFATVATTGAYSDLSGKPTVPTLVSQLTNDIGFTTNSGTVTSVGATAGTGISVSGSPITSSGSLTITNTAPDQTVALTAGTGISTSGTYPNFTIVNTSPDQSVTLTAGTGISTSGTYPNFTITNTSLSVGDGTVTSVSSGNGMDFTAVTGAGVITMGTPSAITSSSTNSVSTTSHTHSLTSIPSATTATTQTAGDNTTKVATTAYVATAISTKANASSISGTINYIPIFTSTGAIGNSHWIQDNYMITPENNSNQLVFSGNTTLMGAAIVLPGGSGTNADSPTLRMGNTGKSLAALQAQSNGVGIGFLAYASDFAGSGNIKRYGTIGIDGKWYLGEDDGGLVNYATEKLQVIGNVLATGFKVSALNTAPITATSAGVTGDIRITSSGIYICTATNTWVRATVATF